MEAIVAARTLQENMPLINAESNPIQVSQCGRKQMLGAPASCIGPRQEQQPKEECTGQGKAELFQPDRSVSRWSWWT